MDKFKCKQYSSFLTDIGKITILFLWNVIIFFNTSTVGAHVEILACCNRKFSSELVLQMSVSHSELVLLICNTLHPILLSMPVLFIMLPHLISRKNFSIHVIEITSLWPRTFNLTRISSQTVPVMSASTLLGVQAPLLAHSVSWDMGFHLWLFPCYLQWTAWEESTPSSCMLSQGAGHCVVTPPDWCGLLTVLSSSWPDQAKGCNEWSQCLAAPEKWFCSVSLTCPLIHPLKASCFFQTIILALFCGFLKIIFDYWIGVSAFS